MRLIIISLCFFANYCLCQNIKVLDSINFEAIEGANIYFENKIIAQTGSNGEVFSLVNLKKAKIKVHHLSYKDKEFSLVNDTIIYLVKNNNLIQEIEISNNIKKNEIFVYPKISNFTFLNLQKSINTVPNSEIALFQPYEETYSNYFIKEILIHPAKGFYDNDNSNKFLPFEVNIYKVDSITKEPLYKIFNENIVVCLKKNENKIIVQLPYYIEYDKNGLSIVIKSYDSNYYFNLTKNKKAHLSFKSIYLKNNSKVKSFTRLSLGDGQFTNWYYHLDEDVKLNYYFGFKLIKK
jgi:hypothetical protein